MRTITEIESDVAKLPPAQVEELANWLEAFRHKRANSPPVESWLQHARGAARPGETTEKIMVLTRGEE